MKQQTSTKNHRKHIENNLFRYSLTLSKWSDKAIDLISFTIYRMDSILTLLEFLQ